MRMKTMPMRTEIANTIGCIDSVMERSTETKI